MLTPDDKKHLDLAERYRQAEEDFENADRDARLAGNRRDTVKSQRDHLVRALMELASATPRTFLLTGGDVLVLDRASGITLTKPLRGEVAL